MGLPIIVSAFIAVSGFFMGFLATEAGVFEHGFFGGSRDQESSGASLLEKAAIHSVSGSILSTDSDSFRLSVSADSLIEGVLFNELQVGVATGTRMSAESPISFGDLRIKDKVTVISPNDMRTLSKITASYIVRVSSAGSATSSMQTLLSATSSVAAPLPIHAPPVIPKPANSIVPPKLPKTPSLPPPVASSSSAPSAPSATLSGGTSSVSPPIPPPTSVGSGTPPVPPLTSPGSGTPPPAPPPPPTTVSTDPLPPPPVP